MSLLTQLTQQLATLTLFTIVLLYACASARVEEPVTDFSNILYIEREIPSNLPSFITYTGLRDEKHRPTGGLIVDTSPTFSIPPDDRDATLFSRSSQTLSNDPASSSAPTVDPSDPPGDSNIVAISTGTRESNIFELSAISAVSFTAATSTPTKATEVPTTRWPSTNSNSKSSALPGDGGIGDEKPPMANVIGIALGVSFGVLVVVAVAIWWSIWWRRRQTEKDSDLPPRYSELDMRIFIERETRRHEGDRRGGTMEHGPSEATGGNNTARESSAGWF
jgi:hypothetical protein